MSRLALFPLLAALLFAACTPESPEPPTRPADAPAAPAPPADTTAEPSLAPDFTLTGLDGTPFTLSEHRGEVVVLNFWATWCVPCLAEMPALEALQREYEGEGVRVVGVSQDTGGVDEILPFAERLGVTYPLLPDPAFSVATRYGGIAALPTTIFVDREGFVAREEVGALTEAELRGIVEELW